MNKSKELIDKAWYLYCEETKGSPAAVDSWEQVPARYKEALLILAVEELQVKHTLQAKLRSCVGKDTRGNYLADIDLYAEQAADKLDALEAELKFEQNATDRALENLDVANRRNKDLSAELAEHKLLVNEIKSLLG